MVDTDNPHATASDIITYIGVPLAVLGVLPILYNTLATLAALSKIKRMLRHSQLKALTRSDVVNRVIEVELPRYAVTPLDRSAQREEYWRLRRNPSSIPGGSWTTFNWRTNAIGMKTQRVEYADQLRQPQVDVAFDELISYLLDLGAVPDPHGWRLLRNTGLWTPVGCSLMMSPDGSQKALTVAPLDDSDGNLSLAVHWSSYWTVRSHTSLPPYWVRLPAPAPLQDEDEAPKEEDAPSPSSSTESTMELAASIHSAHSDKKSLPGDSSDSIRLEAEANATRAISCHISSAGLIDAHPSSFPSGTTTLEPLYIDHLRTGPSPSHGSAPVTGPGVWFASAITAYGTTSETVLWNYKIPDAVVAFARRDSVPCGVLEMLGVVGDADTPEWANTHEHDEAERLEQHMRKSMERARAFAAESRMGVAERMQAMRERVQREGLEQMQEVRDQMAKQKKRQETRLMEALQSPKWTATQVAEHNLAWLKANGHLRPASITLREAVGSLLHRMVLDGGFAKDLCGMLDRWRAWSDNAGMRKTDFEALGEEQVLFAQASLVVAVIRDAGVEAQAGVVVDLQECLRLWKKVRLG